ncbi:hypothetical protein SERLA73DRAFT_188364 [Serpula lacrymans var. lacrymans S7.3]|uniref:Uncharacterized protein n=1 Tax=Serpula lacrymans var. lacrymans (strain S7.3) TaxID=936435 RepID=F8QB67_SERL3|nr:hypothetical protein SERLA73DRAFT_188364 [Serpula lacrymans var. lacrymans S7.3]
MTLIRTIKNHIIGSPVSIQEPARTMLIFRFSTPPIPEQIADLSYIRIFLCGYLPS